MRTTPSSPLFIRVLAAALAAVLAGALFAGCSSGGDTASTTTANSSRASTTSAAVATTSTSASTTTLDAATTTTLTDEAAILATVDRFWIEWLAASNPPDPDHGGLLAIVTGTERELVREELAKKKALGLATRVPSPDLWTHSLEIEEVHPPTAVVADCSVDGLELFEMDGGRTLNDEVATLRWRIHLRIEGGSWRVERNELVAQTSGVHACDG